MTVSDKMLVVWKGNIINHNINVGCDLYQICDLSNVFCHANDDVIYEQSLRKRSLQRMPQHHELMLCFYDAAKIRVFVSRSGPYLCNNF